MEFIMKTLSILGKLSTVIFTLLIVSYSEILSQTFNVSEIDTSEFPGVKADFIALTTGGYLYPNLIPADFSVIENGASMNTTVQVSCNDTLGNQEVSIALVIDQSGSMTDKDTATGQVRWEWVKECAKTFINTIRFDGRTQMCLITFGIVAYLRCPWTNNKNRLLDSLDTTIPGGGTLYEPPFLDYDVGAIKLFKSRPTDVRRVVVFLTDGIPNTGPNADSIITACKEANIQVYVITLLMPMNIYLKQIATETDGDAYPAYTKKELNDIFMNIASDMQTNKLCNISWQAPYGCTDQSRNRDVEITFKRPSPELKVIKSYVAPKKSIAWVQFSDTIINFGSPPANTSVDRIFSITPKESPFKIIDYAIVPPGSFSIVDWGGSPPPFTIGTGRTINIKIRFTQPDDNQLKISKLIFEGVPCPQTVTLVANGTQIIITKPNGGELYSICDTIQINWTGVPTDKKVSLFYNNESKSAWNLITDSASGLQYNWKRPETRDQSLIMGVDQGSINYAWAKNAGGYDNDVGTSLVFDSKSDSSLYVVGYFESEAIFGTKKNYKQGR